MPAQHDQPVDVTVDGYTVRVQNRMYNIGQVISARVDSYPVGFKGGVGRAIWTKSWLLVLSTLFAVGDPEPLEVHLAGLVVLLATVGWIVYQLRTRGTAYRLTVRTAFGCDFIVSRDGDSVINVARAIANAINHPPKTVEQYVVHGNLIQQNGNGNIATQTGTT